MARLDAAFNLADVDASSVIGLRAYHASSTSSHLIVTAAQRILVIDVASRRVTRSFTSTEDGEIFSSPAFVHASNDGVAQLHCAVGTHLWIWRLDAPDLKSDMVKIPLPFCAVEAAALSDGVGLRSADGHACVVVLTDKHDGGLVDPRVVQFANQEKSISSSSSSSIFDGRSAMVRWMADGSFECRIYNFNTRTTEEISLEASETTTTSKKRKKKTTTTQFKSKSMKVFLHLNSICITDGQTLSEWRLETGGIDTNPFSRRSERHISFGGDVRVLQILLEKDVLFCVCPSSSSTLQMRSLKFNTILASQPISEISSKSDASAISCLIGDALCMVDGSRLVSYPFHIPASSCLLSSNFGRKVGDSALITVDSDAGVWLRHRKRGRIEPSDNSVSKPSQPSSHYATAMSLAASSAEEEAALLSQLGSGGNSTKSTRTDLTTMFEALVDVLTERAKEPTAEADSASHWPERLLRFLMTNGEIRRWDTVIDLLLLRKDASALDFVSNQPSLDESSLCRLLRFFSALPDSEGNNNNDDGDDNNGGGNDEMPSSSSIDKRQSLLRVINSSIRHENVKCALKAFSIEDVVEMLEVLVGFSKQSVDDDVEEEEEGSVKSKAASHSLPHAALFRWMTLLIDSHFVEFLVSEDDRRIDLLHRVEAFTQDVEVYFQTRDALDGLLGDMRRRRSQTGACFKTSMDPGEDYCIQIMEI